MSQIWTWEIEAVAMCVATLNELEQKLQHLVAKHHVAIELGEIKLLAEGEQCGVLSYTDVGEWGYEQKGPDA